MGKRKEENLRVKQSIVRALFSHMQEKSLADVHITELVNSAGVARASFYRNYRPKEDVLVTLIWDVLDEFSGQMDMNRSSFYTYENLLLSFQYFQKYREYVLDLYKSGLVSVLLEELNQFHGSVEGSMASSSIEKYQLYMYIGALPNTALVWLTAADGTHAEDMARFFIDSAVKMLRTGTVPPDQGTG